jgi:hypothetical protein
MNWTPAETFGRVALIVLGLILLRAIGGRLDDIRRRLAVLSRVEAKLDLLLKQANIKFDPFADVSTDIVAALRRNQEIEAIKLYRQATGVGLRFARAVGIRSCWASYGYGDRDGCRALAPDYEIAAFPGLIEIVSLARGLDLG